MSLGQTKAPVGNFLLTRVWHAKSYIISPRGISSIQTVKELEGECRYDSPTIPVGVNIFSMLTIYIVKLF